MNNRPTTWQKIAALPGYVRMVNLAMVALCLWLVRYGLLDPVLDEHALDHTLTDRQFHWMVAAVLAVAIAGFWINDFYDRDIDRINRPDRFLVRFNVSFGEFAMGYAGMLLAGAVLTVWLAVETDNLRWWWLYPVSVGTLHLYAARGKRFGLIGNIVVGLMVSGVLWLVWVSDLPAWQALRDLSPERAKNVLWLLTSFTVMLMAANSAREIAKDAEDIAGDEHFGSRTLPLIFGTSAARKAVIGLTVVALAVQCLVGLVSHVLHPFLQWLWLIAGALCAMRITWLMAMPADPRRFQLASAWLKWYLLAGLAGFLVLRA